MMQTRTDETLSKLRDMGIFTARGAAQLGIHSQTLTRLVRTGVVERIARGQYRLAGLPISAHHTLGIVARAAPDAVVCLLSALSYHAIGTELPARVWIAIDRRARPPAFRYPPLRIVRFSGQAFTAGVELHVVEGQPVKVYGVAKTLADLFKYRNKIGLDVALEALHAAWRERRFTMDELDHYARICRVQRVMAPYLEAVVT